MNMFTQDTGAQDRANCVWAHLDNAMTSRTDETLLSRGEALYYKEGELTYLACKVQTNKATYLYVRKETEDEFIPIQYNGGRKVNGLVVRKGVAKVLRAEDLYKKIREEVRGFQVGSFFWFMNEAPCVFLRHSAGEEEVLAVMNGKFLRLIGLGYMCSYTYRVELDKDTATVRLYRKPTVIDYRQFVEGMEKLRIFANFYIRDGRVVRAEREDGDHWYDFGPEFIADDPKAALDALMGPDYLGTVELPTCRVHVRKKDGKFEATVRAGA